MTDEDRKVYIGELAEMVDRRVNTVRNWDRTGRLPVHLRSVRVGGTDNGYTWRYWTTEQAAGIVEWMRTEKLYPGSGLANFNPDPKRVEEMLERLRAKKAA